MNKHEIFKVWNNPPNSFLMDDPLIGDVCTKPFPVDAHMCANPRPRWHFNSRTGKCERFNGCPTRGNNFARKYYCKIQCRYSHLGLDTGKHLLSPDDEFCSQRLPDSAFTCQTKTKRWFYSVESGRCEKFIGCKTAGNNFSRKVSCKTKCLKKRPFSSILQGKNQHYT